MTCKPSPFLLSALLSASLALTAVAAPDGTVMELELIRQGDEIVAVVMLDHPMGFPLELELQYNVNGQNVKTEPVVVLGATAFVEPLGPVDQFYGVCVAMDGLIRIHGDLTRPTQGSRCDLYYPGQTANPLVGSLSTRPLDARLPGPQIVEPVERRVPAPVLRTRR